MIDLVAADIGGTHARFALARIDAGAVVGIDPPLVLRCADHPSLAAAFMAFAAALGTDAAKLPRHAAFALACPISGDTMKLTNNPWVIRPAKVNEDLGLDGHLLINDFEAVAYAVSACDAAEFRHLCGPDGPLPGSGVISVIGPGTGLGVAMLLRDGDEPARVLPTEASHGDFAPIDAIDDAILAHLRGKFGRVSTERAVSGPGLAEIMAAMAPAGHPQLPPDDAALWQQALAGSDALAAAALERFCCLLGSFAGSVALAHGASGVVIAGGLGARLADHLPRSGFAARLLAKGRMAPLLARLPVKSIAHAQPGLLGAATAFARNPNRISA